MFDIIHLGLQCIEVSVSCRTFLLCRLHVLGVYSSDADRNDWLLIVLLSLHLLLFSNKPATPFVKTFWFFQIEEQTKSFVEHSNAFMCGQIRCALHPFKEVHFLNALNAINV